jgi:hypothetical protein
VSPRTADAALSQRDLRIEDQNAAMRIASALVDLRELSPPPAQTEGKNWLARQRAVASPKTR